MKKEQIEKLANFIIANIEKTKKLPWSSGLLNEDMLPRNWKSKKNYRGINKLLLMFCGTSDAQEYCTFNQAKAAEGMVEKGSKGFPVVFGKRWNKTERRDAEPGDDPDDCCFIHKISWVFPVEKCGLEPHRTAESREADNEEDKDIEGFVKMFFEKTGLTLKTKKSGTAYYAPGEHKICIAGIKYYKSAEDYYSTLFHEMIHSTMKELGRYSEKCSFGSKVYSEEEVVAETGAMLLCMHFGVKGQTDNSSVYLDSWSRKLKENKDWLVNGLGNADRAVEYMMKVVYGEECQAW